MSYAIMRCKKLATMGSVASSLQHAYRERETANADPQRTGDADHRKLRDRLCDLTHFDDRLFRREQR